MNKHYDRIYAAINLDAISLYKTKKLKELQRFQPSPSSVVQTRNGLQAYWFIKDAPTPSQWRRIENYLVEKFDADSELMQILCQIYFELSLYLSI